MRRRLRKRGRQHNLVRIVQIGVHLQGELRPVDSIGGVEQPKDTTHVPDERLHLRELHEPGVVAKLDDLVGEKEPFVHGGLGRVGSEEQLPEQLDGRVRVHLVQQADESLPAGDRGGVASGGRGRHVGFGQLPHRLDEIDDRGIEPVAAPALDDVGEPQTQLGDFLPGMVQIGGSRDRDAVVVVEVARSDDPVVVVHLAAEQHLAHMAFGVVDVQQLGSVNVGQVPRILAREKHLLRKHERVGIVVLLVPPIGQLLRGGERVRSRGDPLVEDFGFLDARRAPPSLLRRGALVVQPRPRDDRPVRQREQPDLAGHGRVRVVVARVHHAIDAGVRQRLVPVEHRRQAACGPREADVDADRAREQRRAHGERVRLQRLDLVARDFHALHLRHGDAVAARHDLAFAHDAVAREHVVDGPVELHDGRGQRMSVRGPHEQIAIAVAASEREHPYLWVRPRHPRAQPLHDLPLLRIRRSLVDLEGRLRERVVLQQDRLANQADRLGHDAARGLVHLLLALLRRELGIRRGSLGVAFKRALHRVPHPGEVVAPVAREYLPHAGTIGKHAQVAGHDEFGKRHPHVGDAPKRALRTLQVHLAKPVQGIQHLLVRLAGGKAPRCLDLIPHEFDRGKLPLLRAFQYRAEIFRGLRRVDPGQHAVGLRRRKRRHHGNGERHGFDDELLSVGNRLPQHPLEPVLVLIPRDAEETTRGIPQTLLEHLLDVSVVPDVLQPLEHGLRVAVGCEPARDLLGSRVGHGLRAHQRLGPVRLRVGRLKQLCHLPQGAARAKDSLADRLAGSFRKIFDVAVAKRQHLRLPHGHVVAAQLGSDVAVARLPGHQRIFAVGDVHRGVDRGVDGHVPGAFDRHAGHAPAKLPRGGAPDGPSHELLGELARRGFHGIVGERVDQLARRLAGEPGASRDGAGDDAGRGAGPRPAVGGADGGRDSDFSGESAQAAEPVANHAARGGLGPALLIRQIELGVYEILVGDHLPAIQLLDRGDDARHLAYRNRVSDDVADVRQIV